MTIILSYSGCSMLLRISNIAMKFSRRIIKN